MLKIKVINTIIITIICITVSLGFKIAFANSQTGNIEIKAEVPELSKETGFLSLSGLIKKFSIQNQLYEYKNLVFYTEFQNIGEQDLKPQGYIIIKNWFGKEIERLPFNQQGMISPISKTTTYENIWSSQNLIGAGKYSASLVVNYGTAENLTSQIHFWIFPWKVTGISLSFLILIWLIHQIMVIELVGYRKVGWRATH